MSMPINTCEVAIHEVATRDGFQSEITFVPTSEKIKLINALSRTGVKKIEVTSFVSPKAIPQLRDAAEVMQGIERQAGVVYVALVPNQQGAQRALECGVDEVNLVMSLSESHNLVNMRMRCEQSLAEFCRVVQMLENSPVRINGTIATAFGCPFEGNMAINRVLETCHRYQDLGLHSITLADTTGMAYPSQVSEICRQFLSNFPQLPVTLHFHNTRGMGLANVMAAYAQGARAFDASLGGLGGCPYAPGATGNVCTEDVVHMLQCCGIRTGVDLESLLRAAGTLAPLLGHTVAGQVLQAGERLRRYGMASTN
jgi:hydroxymethylglutaryl-CoA lyase